MQKFDKNSFIKIHKDRFGIDPNYEIIFYACEKYYWDEIAKLKIEIEELRIENKMLKLFEIAEASESKNEETQNGK